MFYIIFLSYIFIYPIHQKIIEAKGNYKFQINIFITTNIKLNYMKLPSVRQKTVGYWQFYVVQLVIFTNTPLKIKETGKNK